MASLTRLNPLRPNQPFPNPDKALEQPNGLLAVGGCLSTERLLNAYRSGVFPWYSDGEPILWWSPNPRLVLFPDRLILSRSLSKTLRKKVFTTSIDQAFKRVMIACAAPRFASEGTWISQEIINAYQELYQLGHAHSVEVWHDGLLVGGLYGVSYGQVFFGESMFHTQTDASKVALAFLVEQLRKWNYQLIDCQVQSSHLQSLGAELISRTRFNQLLERYCQTTCCTEAWKSHVDHSA